VADAQRVADAVIEYHARDKVHTSIRKPVTPCPPLHTTTLLFLLSGLVVQILPCPRKRSPAGDSPHDSVLSIRFSLPAAHRCAVWSPTTVQEEAPAARIPPLWIRLSPVAQCRHMHRVRRAARRPTYSPAHCECLPPLLMCCERRDPGLIGQTLPTSSSSSRPSYKSNTHLKPMSDVGQVEQPPSSSNRARRRPASGRAQMHVAWRGQRRPPCRGRPHA